MANRTKTYIAADWTGDKDAVEKLTEKLKQLEESQETMKQVNAYYRKNGSLDGCTLISQKTINSIKDLMIRIPYHTQPFASYELTNNNASIKATKERLEALQKLKEEGTKETIQSEVCKVVENSELMRIQLLFDGVPSEQIRSILKSHGFKWSPYNKAWQRQLTDNARYSTKKVIEQLEKLTA
jgi:DNA-binding Lrp family transcriptional regulator